MEYRSEASAKLRAHARATCGVHYRVVVHQRASNKGYGTELRYGYKDKKQQHHSVFECLLIEGLEKIIQREAVELSLQSEDDVDSDEEPPTPVKIITTPIGSLYSLDLALLADYVPSTPGIPEVSEEYKLLPDTMYLTVCLIDRFLSRNLKNRDCNFWSCHSSNSQSNLVPANME